MELTITLTPDQAERLFFIAGDLCGKDIPGVDTDAAFWEGIRHLLAPQTANRTYRITKGMAETLRQVSAPDLDTAMERLAVTDPNIVQVMSRDGSWTWASPSVMPVTPTRRTIPITVRQESWLWQR